MARGRKKLNINREAFQRVVTELESQREFTNPTELWQAVEQTEWAKGLEPRPLTAAVAYLRAKEFGIITKTKPGKRGGRMTEERIARMHEGKRTRRSRAEKMGSFSPTFNEMRKEYPKTLLPLIDRAERGSLRAAITLKCLDCSGFVRAEARNCQVTGCSLYPHRPGGKELGEIPETVETEHVCGCTTGACPVESTDIAAVEIPEAA